MLTIVNTIMQIRKATGIKPSHSNWRMLFFTGVLLLWLFVLLFKGEYAGWAVYVSLIMKYFYLP